MQEIDFVNEVSGKINVPLKEDQVEALESVYQFLFTGGANSVFILRGYAGTGKTTLMGGLIRWFHSINRKTVLLAPTGRAAKVLAQHSGYPASTIHRRIYTVKQDDFGRMSMQLMHNKSEKTIFIVDEASMIGEATVSEDGQVSRSLLQDLLEYVYSGERCRLILIGDNAQLPPVGMELSPALDKKKLKKITGAPVFEYTLTQVVRQAQESLILKNATDLRMQLSNNAFENLHIEVSANRDVNEVDPHELEDRLSDKFQSEKAHESVIICRSNKDATKFNQQIRNRILFRESEIEAGDKLMIVKNNYFWKTPGKRQNFLANGDMISVERVNRLAEFGPFRFADCQVYFSDDPEQSFDLLLLLNALDFDGPSIQSKQLFKMREALIDSGEIDSNDPEAKFFQNPYFHAVQVKYAYAVTCHKSQGGQWTDVFIYQGYFTEEMLDRSYFRWLYTALTRATTKVHLIGFHENFLETV
jgi:exodeoxyribonuclease V